MLKIQVLLITGPPTAMHISTNNYNKHALICLNPKRPHTITEMIDNINMDS